MSFTDVLALFEVDPATKVIVLIGEIGRTAEEEAAEYIAAHVTKPVVSMIPGRHGAAGEADGACRSHYHGGTGHVCFQGGRA